MNFQIVNVSDKVVELEMVYQPSEYFSVDLPKSIAPGETAEAFLKLSEKGVETKLEKSFTLSIDDEKKSRYTVPVKRHIRKSVKKTSLTSGRGKGK